MLVLRLWEQNHNIFNDGLIVNLLPKLIMMIMNQTVFTLLVRLSIIKV